MRQKAAVVEPLSPSNQKPCWQCQALVTQWPFCQACGSLQPAPEAMNYFSVLGFPPLLILSEEKLRERFYELSRQIHPDKFAARKQPEPQYALRWTTLLNRAYQTIRDPLERSTYLLELNGLGGLLKTAKVPLDLAEKYFELQELMETTDSPEPLKAFHQDLLEQKVQSGNDWEALAKQWAVPSTPEDRRKQLGQLADHLVHRKYLTSMTEDIERKLGISSGDSRH